MSATPCLSLLYGMVTASWYAWLALRRRVSMSAIGSVIVMMFFFLAVVSPERPSTGWSSVVEQPRACERHVETYQEDLVTPGSSPRWAISRRQIRHRPNLR